MAHKKKNYPERQRKGKKIEDWSSDDSVSVVDGRPYYGSNNALFVIENCMRRQDEWILDSGCFYYMCLNRY